MYYMGLVMSQKNCIIPMIHPSNSIQPHTLKSKHIIISKTRISLVSLLLPVESSFLRGTGSVPSQRKNPLKISFNTNETVLVSKTLIAETVSSLISPQRREHPDISYIQSCLKFVWLFYLKAAICTSMTVFKPKHDKYYFRIILQFIKT